MEESRPELVQMEAHSNRTSHEKKQQVQWQQQKLLSLQEVLRKTTYRYYNFRYSKCICANTNLTGWWQSHEEDQRTTVQNSLWNCSRSVWKLCDLWRKTKRLYV